MQQWNTQINIPAVPETDNFGKYITRYYTQRSLANQTVQENKATSKPLDIPTILHLRLTEKLIWVKQWSLTEDKL